MPTIRLSRTARKSLTRLMRADPGRGQQATDTIDALAEDPRPDGAKKLKGKLKGRWAVRAGIHIRVVYRIEGDEILIIDIGQREGAY